jgi:nicotinamidase-related amidase
MITIENKVVYTTLAELVNRKITVVIVIDMQNDFCKAGWTFDRLVIDISMYSSMLPRLSRLLTGARDVGVQVIYIQMTVLPNRMSDSPAQIRFNLRLHLASHGATQPLLYTIEDTPGQEIIAELAAEPGDLVVRKYRSSGFWGTNLDMLLTSNGI